MTEKRDAFHPPAVVRFEGALRKVMQMNSIGDNYLPALAHAITVALAGHRNAALKSAEHAIEAGRLLVDAKAAVAHGEWSAWLKANCSLGERSAQRYMQIFRSGLNPPQVADLGIRGAAEALAKRKPPFVLDCGGGRVWPENQEELEEARAIRDVEKAYPGHIGRFLDRLVDERDERCEQMGEAVADEVWGVLAKLRAAA